MVIHSSILALALTVLAVEAQITSPSPPPVVLLHGLARSEASMSTMAAALEAEGFKVCNVNYPSTEHAVSTLAADHVMPAIAQCLKEVGSEGQPLNFVTHSMGGIIVRQLAASGAVKSFGRVVMLSPPNHGSEVVDSWGEWWLFQTVNGPAGSELGTSAQSVPNQLGPAPFQVGIITGSQSINWILSSIIPGTDDGKVSIESAKLDSMKDFMVLPATHPFIMKNADAIKQTIRFLKTGAFEHAPLRAGTDK